MPWSCSSDPLIRYCMGAHTLVIHWVCSLDSHFILTAGLGFSLISSLLRPSKSSHLNCNLSTSRVTPIMHCMIRVTSLSVASSSSSSFFLASTLLNARLLDGKCPQPTLMHLSLAFPGVDPRDTPGDLF